MTRNNARTGFTSWRPRLFMAVVLTVAGAMQPGDVLRFGFPRTDLTEWGRASRLAATRAARDPHVLYMHIDAHGDAANRERDAARASRQPAPARCAGRVNGGVYLVDAARAKRIVAYGMEVPPSMGVSSAMNFQPTGGGKAAITASR